MVLGGSYKHIWSARWCELIASRTARPGISAVAGEVGRRCRGGIDVVYMVLCVRVSIAGGTRIADIEVG